MHNEGVQVQAARGRGVQHGGGHGVGSHGRAADGVDLVGTQARLLEYVKHDVANERDGLVMRGGTTHVHVEVGFEARDEGDLATDGGQFVNELGQAGDVGVVGAHGPDGNGTRGLHAG